MRTRIGFVALTLLGFFVASSSLVAQTQITTGAIQGTVALPGTAGIGPWRREMPHEGRGPSTQLCAVVRVLRQAVQLRIVNAVGGDVSCAGMTYPDA